MKTSAHHITLDKSALQKNLKFIRQLIGKNRVFSSVVKGNAYGHSIEHYVPMAENCGVRHFSVFSAEEANRVFKVKKKNTDLMIMGYMDDAQMEWTIANNIEFFVFDIERIEKAATISKKIKCKARLNIDVETGMNRLGIPQYEWPEINKTFEKYGEFVELSGLCTHYAGAESISNFYRIQKQIKRFGEAQKWFEANGLKPLKRHTACSAATINFPATRMEMVRIGILQYGYWPSRETLVGYLNNHKNKTDPLERIISWKSKVMDLKTVKSGEFVGYGTTFMAETDMQLATVPVGYANGYTRDLSNRGRVLIKGQRASVVGMVNMSMFMIDITNISGVKPGDVVTLIGDQDNQSITVTSFGELSSQLNYELLTRLPEDIPRKIIE